MMIVVGKGKETVRKNLKKFSFKQLTNITYTVMFFKGLITCGLAARLLSPILANSGITFRPIFKLPYILRELLTTLTLGTILILYLHRVVMESGNWIWAMIGT